MANSYETLLKATKKVRLELAEAAIDEINNGQDDFDDGGQVQNIDEKLSNVTDKICDESIVLENTIADNFHNIAVALARFDHYDDACRVLKRGLLFNRTSVDIIADLIRYSISCGNSPDSELYYREHLCKISKKLWNWRAFSFSIDYLINEINNIGDSNKAVSSLSRQASKLACEFVNSGVEPRDQAFFDQAQVARVFNGFIRDSEAKEEDILETGLNACKKAPKCALRLADIRFHQGEFGKSIDLLKRCKAEDLAPQPGINAGYVFLLLALSKASVILQDNEKVDYSKEANMIKSVYKDIDTAINHGLNSVFNNSAQSAKRIIEAQTGIKSTSVSSDSEYDW